MTVFEQQLLAALTRIADEVARQTDVLEAGLADAPPQSVPEPSGPCTHPPELRVDLGYTQGTPEWQCACGYHWPEEQA